MRIFTGSALLLILATPIQAQTFVVVETTIGQVHQALAKNRLRPARRSIRSRP